MTAEKFVAAARRLKGSAWRHRGRKPWAVDCVGLVVLSARDAGLQLEDAVGYGREPWEDRLRQELRARFGEPDSKARVGNIALIRWNKGEPSHMAVIGDHPDGGLTLIHASNLHGVVECSLRGTYAEAVIETYRPHWSADVD